MFNVHAFLSYFDNEFLLGGLIWTVLLTIFPMLAGLLLGMVLALARGSDVRPFSAAAAFYIWLFRGTPLIVQLVIIYTGLPQIGLKFGVVTSAFLGLTMNEAAYLSEIIRAGFAAIPSGQRDAAKALGLRPAQTLRLVTLPQAFRIILPPLGNSVNGLLKATAITSVISMEEMMRRGQMLMQVNFDVLEVYCAIAIYYLVLTSLWDAVQRALERRANRGHAAVTGLGPAPVVVDG
ncbi:MAG TPA: amino acid ABC transporter permease [Rhodopila sp.]|uniref:amino acid ABC transporter permease n=1 Tax=Rhodopila sp. TaxID=2480087 RepID=UPI002CAA7459|nr:amino acid ABC transporter permease [Rhodopila sp.]HVY15196.1 amino acid ABC transporter permease [Rhodopila sp.]